MGGKNTRSEATRLAGIPIQTSMYGRVIPKVWGTGRVSANLVWYNGFQAISHVSKTKTGGKGGGTNTNTTYTYTASIILGISQGPIASIRKVYRDKTVFTNGAQTALQQAGLSLSTGSIGQSVWPYLTSNYSSQAIGYSGLAYAYAANYSLGDNAQLTNHGFEVVSTVKESGRDDAAPAAIIADALNMVPLWQSAMLADTTAFNNYTKAADIWLSPVLELAVPAKDFIQQILKVTNCEAVWSAGQLKFIPYTDVSLTANGATFTPDLTPLYDIDDSVTTDKGSDDPIEYELGRDADAYNYITINYLDRSRDYADASIPGTDLASIVEYGNRKADPFDYKMICETSVAANVAQLLVTRTSVMRRKFKLSLPPQYFLLEPMDLITVTRANLGLDRELCRVLDTDEDEDGDITVTIEEVLAGAAAGAIITRQPSSGYIPNYDVDSGNANAPIIIQPPRQMTEGSLEMWIAAAGGSNWGGADIWVSLDGLSYERRGQVKSGCRYGVTTSALAIASDPQNGTLGINIGTTGTIDPATQAEFDAGVTLCMIDQEVIAYRDATLTGTGQYTLGQLRRGLFGTTIANHSSGATFARLDAAVATIPFDKQNIGKTVYIKLQSFNIYGRKYQDISTLTAYQAVIGQSGSMYVSTGAASQIGTNVILPDGSVPPQSQLDNTQQQWTDVNNRPTTLAALDSAANTLVTGLNTEVTNARNGAATLLAAVQAAAQTATYNLVTGVPTQSNGTAAPTASAPNGSIYRQTDGTNTILVWVRENGVWVADYNAKSNFDSLSTTVNGHTTSISNLSATTTNQATSITNLTAFVAYKPNLLKNPSGALNLDNWIKVGPTIATAQSGGGEGFFFYTNNATSTNFITYSQDVYVYPLAPYSLQAEIFAGGLNTFAKAKVIVEWRTATANNGWGAECAVIGGNNWSLQKAQNMVAPANTIFARVYFTIENISAGAWSATSVAWRRIKFEQNASCTMYSDDASSNLLNSQLQTAKTDITSLQTTKIDSTGAQALINTSLNAVFGAGTAGQSNVLANYLTTATAGATYATITALNTVDAKFANYLTAANASSTYLTQANAGATYATIATTNNLSSNFANYYTKTQSDSNYYSKTYTDATYAMAANLTTLQSSVNNAFAVIPTNSPTPKSWTWSNQSTQAAAPDLSQTVIDSGNVATSGTYALKSMIPLNPTRVYEVEAVIQIMAGNGQIGVNINTFNNDETASPSGGNWSVASNWVTYGAGTYTIRGRYKSNGTFGTHTVNGNVITWSGQQPWANPSTSAKGRVGIWYGNGDNNFKTKPISLKITDVTDIAGAEANITSLAATEATHYSSLATLTTNLTAKASAGQYQIQNAGFDVYTNATGVPDLWANWSNGSFASRVSDGNGGYAMQLYSSGGDNVGIQSLSTNITVGSWIVLVAKVKLVSGTFVGAGVWYDGSNPKLSFYSEVDANGVAVGNGVVGRTYYFSKLVQTTQADFNIYAMNHWDGGFGSVAAANNIIWYECGWRYATQAEIQANKAINDPLGTGTTLSAAITNEQIARANGDSALTAITTTLTNNVNNLQSQLTVTASNLTTLDGRVSLYYGMKLDGNGVTSFELMNGANVPYGGIAKLTASKFLIYGDTIVSGTITGAALAAGSITTNKLNIGGTTGARLALTYNLIQIFDSNNVSRVKLGIW